MSSCDFCKFSNWCPSKAEDITWCFNKSLLNNAYQQGRADMKKEIEEHSVFYSNKSIEDIVLEARQSAIDEIIEWLKTNPKYVTCVSSDCSGEVNSKIVEYYEHLVQQLKELKEQKKQ